MLLQEKAELLKASVPVTITGLSIFGVPINEVVYLLTAISTVWFVTTSMYDRFKKRKKKE